MLVRHSRDSLFSNLQEGQQDFLGLAALLPCKLCFQQVYLEFACCFASVARFFDRNDPLKLGDLAGALAVDLLGRGENSIHLI